MLNPSTEKSYSVKVLFYLIVYYIYVVSKINFFFYFFINFKYFLALKSSSISSVTLTFLFGLRFSTLDFLSSSDKVDKSKGSCNKRCKNILLCTCIYKTYISHAVVFGTEPWRGPYLLT